MEVERKVPYCTYLTVPATVRYEVHERTHDSTVVTVIIMTLQLQRLSQFPKPQPPDVNHRCPPYSVSPVLPSVPRCPPSAKVRSTGYFTLPRMPHFPEVPSTRTLVVGLADQRHPHPLAWPCVAASGLAPVASARLFSRWGGLRLLCSLHSAPHVVRAVPQASLVEE